MVKVKYCSRLYVAEVNKNIALVISARIKKMLCVFIFERVWDFLLNPTLETQKYRSSFSTPNVFDFRHPRAIILQPIKNIHVVYPPESFTLVHACIKVRVGQISVCLCDSAHRDSPLWRESTAVTYETFQPRHDEIWPRISSLFPVTSSLQAAQNINIEQNIATCGGGGEPSSKKALLNKR